MQAASRPGCSAGRAAARAMARARGATLREPCWTTTTGFERRILGLVAGRREDSYSCHGK